MGCVGPRIATCETGQVPSEDEVLHEVSNLRAELQGVSALPGECAGMWVLHALRSPVKEALLGG